MRKSILALILAFAWASWAEAQSIFQEVGLLRGEPDCAVKTCSVTNLVCVDDKDADTIGNFYCCNTTTGLFVPCQAAGGAGGAPINAQYLLLALNPVLNEDRLFTPGDSLTGTDGGADGDYTLRVDETLVSRIASASAPLMVHKWIGDTSKILDPAGPSSHFTISQDMNVATPSAWASSPAPEPEGTLSSNLPAATYNVHWYWRNASGSTQISPNSADVVLATADEYIRVQGADLGTRPVAAEWACFHIVTGTDQRAVNATFDKTNAVVQQFNDGCYDADTIYSTGWIDLYHDLFLGSDPPSNTTGDVDLLKIDQTLNIDVVTDSTDITKRNELRLSSGRLEISTDGTAFHLAPAPDSDRTIVVDCEGHGHFTTVTAAVAQVIANADATADDRYTILVLPCDPQYDECVDLEGLKHTSIRGLGMPRLDNDSITAGLCAVGIEFVGCVTTQCKDVEIAGLSFHRIIIGDGTAASPSDNGHYREVWIHDNVLRDRDDEIQAPAATFTCCYDEARQCSAVFENNAVIHDGSTSTVTVVNLAVDNLGNLDADNNCYTNVAFRNNYIFSQNIEEVGLLIVRNAGKETNGADILFSGNVLFSPSHGTDTVTEDGGHFVNLWGQIGKTTFENNLFISVFSQDTCDAGNCDHSWIETAATGAGEESGVAWFRNNTVITRFETTGLANDTFSYVLRKGDANDNKKLYFDGNVFRLDVVSGDFNTANVNFVRRENTLGGSAVERIRNQELPFPNVQLLASASDGLKAWESIPRSDLALDTRGQARIGRTTDGFFWYDGSERRAALGTATGEAADLACTTCVSDGEIDATGITTRSKLPGALAYEDEANTYQAGDQSFDDNRLFIQDGIDNTKKIQFQASAITTGNTRSYTFKDLSGTVPLQEAANTYSSAGIQSFLDPIQLESGNDLVLEDPDGTNTIAFSTQNRTTDIILDWNVAAITTCSALGNAGKLTIDASGFIVCQADISTGGGNVDLLDGSVHQDTTIGTVLRGDVITGQTATPKWTRLALSGGATAFLGQDGTDVAWETIAVGDLPTGHVDALTDLAAALCGTNEILEDQGASWGCIATPAGGGTVSNVGDCNGPDCFIDGTNEGSALTYEGATVDANQTVLSFTGDPGGAFTVTIPNETGNICTTGSVCTGYDPTGGDDLSDDGIAALSDVAATTGTGTTAVFSVGPALTGDPTVPTAAGDDNDTSAASTAFVQQEHDDSAGSCTNQFVRGVNASAAPTCETVVMASDVGTFSSADLRGRLTDEDGTGADIFNTPTAFTLDVESGTNAITTVSKILIDAASCVGASGFLNWDDAGTGDTAPAAACNDTGSIQRPSADFAGGAVNSFERTFKLASDWTGAIDLSIRYVTTAASPTGNVEWDVSTVCRAVGESWDAAFNAAQTITDAAGAQNALNDATQTGLTTTGCAVGEDLTIKVSRDGTNDTNNDLALMLHGEITLRRAQ